MDADGPVALSIDRAKLPRHVAIIMDGNGRWARSRGLPRVEGHREGAESVRSVVRASRALGISALTLFAFSEQNWDRPPDEVDALMELLYRYVLEERDEIMENDIRLTAVGDVSRLPRYVQQALSVLIDVSAKNRSMTLALALSYGGREDIAAAVRRLAAEVAAGKLAPEVVDEAALDARLSTAGMPPVDLMIRTSGEKRISNFLLWQVAYAELMFLDTMWPDFRKPDLLEAIAEYQRRERRFGRTSEQLESEGLPSTGASE
ncbi:MAG: isoprenyl transferase [Proteobacteria bacterium]|nr:MAG: isoprenyl transferase [Pseudomonadota bacterium]PIE17127.1 MAG: isoprenyl transferase [Pseudomonadota bacterium]